MLLRRYQNGFQVKAVPSLCDETRCIHYYQLSELHSKEAYKEDCLAAYRLYTNKSVPPGFLKETRWQCGVSYPDVEDIGVAAMLCMPRQHHACCLYNIPQETRLVRC